MESRADCRRSSRRGSGLHLRLGQLQVAATAALHARAAARKTPTGAGDGRPLSSPSSPVITPNRSRVAGALDSISPLAQAPRLASTSMAGGACLLQRWPAAEAREVFSIDRAGELGTGACFPDRLQKRAPLRGHRRFGFRPETVCGGLLASGTAPAPRLAACNTFRDDRPGITTSPRSASARPGPASLRSKNAPLPAFHVRNVRLHRWRSRRGRRARPSASISR